MDAFEGWTLLRVWIPGIASAIALFAMIFYPEVVTQIVMGHAQHKAEQLTTWLYPQLGLPLPSRPGG